MHYDSMIDNENNFQNSWVARQDAKAKDAENIKLYTEAEIQTGMNLERQVARVFLRSRVFRQHREKFIVVKVERPVKADRDSSEVADMEKQYVIKPGYKRIRTATAILYRIPKQAVEA
jgi:hypothetical protein